MKPLAYKLLICLALVLCGVDAQARGAVAGAAACMAVYAMR